MSWGSSRSVLVVDDDEEFCKTLKRILNPKYNVEYCYRIDKVASNLIKNRYGVVLMDFHLDPSVDGIELAENIHQLFPLTYIIMISGYAEFEDIKRAINVGSIDYFLPKPIEPEKLVDTVDNAMATYEENIETTRMLHANQQSTRAQDVLKNLFEDQIGITSRKLDLNAVIISRSSIPVYSNFVDSSRLQDFTDTIFSGFMTALNMVGQEAFSTDRNVSTLIFGDMGICFEFYRDYQFSFILYLGNFDDHQLIHEKLHEFVNQVTTVIHQDDLTLKDTDPTQLNIWVDELVKSIQSLNKI